MKIGMILLSRFPPDIRVEKEIDTLRKEHSIALLCPHRHGQKKREAARSGLEIFRVLSGVSRRWSHFQLLRTCHSNAWQRQIDNFVQSEDIDVLHIHDLPLLGAALTIGSARNIPVVADLHEDYPAMLADEQKAHLADSTSIGTFVSRLTVSVERWQAYEASVVPRATRIITVIEESKDRIHSLGVPNDRIAVVGNYASLGDDPSIEAPGKRAHTSHSKSFKLIYAGGFSVTRDLATVVNAVALLPQEDFSALEVLLLGGTPRLVEELRRQAESLSVSDRITVLPWVPLREAEQHMSKAHVGLVPHVKSPHTDTTIPHKIFQYMARGLPVIVSDCAPLQRIVEEGQCGLKYSSGDAESLAASIKALYRDESLCERLGACGRQAVRDRYNWNLAGDALLSLYRQIGEIDFSRRVSP